MSNELVTTTGLVNNFSAFDRVASQESTGERVKFTKGGLWTAGAAELDITNSIVLADMFGLRVGFLKWKDAKPVDQKVGRVLDGFEARREDLDELDESAWPLGQDGKPQDPWQFGYFLRVENVEDGTSYLWTASSFGARKAIGDISRKFARKRQNPIVRLTASSYKHRNPAFGRIFEPVLEVVEWDETSAAPALAAPAPKAFVDDEAVPF
jgi:hypothetical protein